MINSLVLVLQLGLLLYLIFFKRNNDRLVRYLNDNKPGSLSLIKDRIKIMDLIQKLIFIFLSLFIIYGFVMNILYNSYSLILFFVVFISLSFIFCLLSPGKILTSMGFSTKGETYFSKTKKKAINALIYIVFFFGFVSLGIFMIASRTLNSIAKDYEFSENSDIEFPIDFETNLFVEGEYLYLYSDLASGINVYNLEGEYIRSYYFYGGMNGSSMIYFKDDYFFISTKSSSALIRYQNGEYEGHLEVEYFDDYDQITVYDKNGDILMPSFSLEDFWTIYAFDNDYIYYESSSNGGGYFKTNGVNLEQWNYDISSFVTQIEDGDYLLISNEVYKNNDVIINTSEIHFVITHFAFIWLIMFMCFSVIFPLTKLIYLNDLTDIREVKPITSKTDLDLLNRYKKSLRIDFFVSIILTLTIFILYNIFLSEEFFEGGIILLVVFFFLGMILNDLLFGFSSIGKRLVRLKLVDTETDGKPKIKAVIKRRMLEIFSTVEVNIESLDRIDNKTRTKLIDIKNKII